MKRVFKRILVIILLVSGCGMLTYPLVSNLYYEYQQNKLAEYYDNVVTENIPEEDKSSEFQKCRDYNASLIMGGVLLTDPFDESQLNPSSMPYAGLLNETGDGSMGYLEIPAIDIKLMIYHGTTEDVLQKGVGHLQGSSLPVGGTGSHAVLSAHTGLNSKKLFTDLDKLELGDIFYIHVLDEVLAYQVDKISVVSPEDTDDLSINSEQDYVTLVTCTPYGINTHRLLVRGTRVEYHEEQMQNEKKESRGSTWTEQYIQAFCAGTFGIAVLAVLFSIWKAADKRKH